MDTEPPDTEAEPRLGLIKVLREKAARQKQEARQLLERSKQLLEASRQARQHAQKAPCPGRTDTPR